MKIPDKIRIGGVEYDIKFVDNLRKGIELLYGEISYEDSEIRISNSDGKSHEFQCITLMHEILHGIADHANLDIEKADTEQVVDTLAKGLYAVLQDNGGRLFDLSKDDAPNE